MESDSAWHGGDGGDDEQQPHPSPSPSSSPPPPTSLSSSAVANGENNREDALSALPKSIGGGGGGAAAAAAASPPPNFMGKHRMAAAVAQLQHQIQFIQEELHDLQSFGHSSLVCQQLVRTVESVPDALLPETKGPAGVGWDRWFQGVQGSRSAGGGRKRWI